MLTCEAEADGGTYWTDCTVPSSNTVYRVTIRLTVSGAGPGHPVLGPAPAPGGLSLREQSIWAS